MLGFLIGTACLIGLIATVRGGRRFARGRHGGGCGGSWRGRGGYGDADCGGGGGSWDERGTSGG